MVNSIQRDENGRRYYEDTDEMKHRIRVYLPSGRDGEVFTLTHLPAGEYYCNTFADLPNSRWYTMVTVGVDPDASIWLAWERCDPPRGHIGLAAPKNDPEHTKPMHPYDEEIADTIPGLNPP